MQLLINIPDEMYDTINRGIYSSTYDGKIIRDIVLNGTPLPKEHGRLIDADELKKVINQFDYYDQVSDAQTIIEADKEGD